MEKTPDRGTAGGAAPFPRRLRRKDIARGERDSLHGGGKGHRLRLRRYRDHGKRDDGRRVGRERSDDLGGRIDRNRNHIGAPSHRHDIRRLHGDGRHDHGENHSDDHSAPGRGDDNEGLLALPVRYGGRIPLRRKAARQGGFHRPGTDRFPQSEGDGAERRHYPGAALRGQLLPF